MRVFKRIRRKHPSITVQAKWEHETLEESSLRGGGGDTQSSGSEDQPCYGSTLPDQRHFISQRCLQAPSETANTKIVMCQDFVLEEHYRFITKMAFLTLIFVLGTCLGFHYGLNAPSKNYKEVMKLTLSRQNEALHEHLQKQIGAFHQQVAGLKSLTDALASVHGCWEEQTTPSLDRHENSSTIECIGYQKEDFALKSSGASVVRSSESFKTGAQICVLGLCWEYSRSPDVILERDNVPGNCWAMHGSQGFLVIRLSQAICPTAVTLDHISKSISHTEEISSAPKNFTVYGMKNHLEEGGGTFLGSFVYKNDGFPTQTFKLEGARPVRFQYLLVRMLSNWGHPDYTCIYGFRVYGERAC